MTSSGVPAERTRLARPPGQAGGRLHLRIALAGLGILAVALALGGHALSLAAEAPDQRGPVMAFFPPGWSSPALLAATARADGLLKAEGRLPGLALVAGDAPDLARRLRAAGAWLVLAPLPVDLLTLGGCAGVVPQHPDQRRPPAVL